MKFLNDKAAVDVLIRVEGQMKYLIMASMLSFLTLSCTKPSNEANAVQEWEVDFIDDFETFNPNNWQDQRIWVNEENQCYVPDGQYGTREISNGTLKLKVVKINEAIACDNFDKYGVQHPATEFAAGRICSKNRKEFIKGKWTARLRLSTSGEIGMFPAWWLLGAQNNEPPVQEEDETVCWPMTGSGEIDIFEHHGDHMKDQFHLGVVISEGECEKGDWNSKRTNITAMLSDFHEYSVEWKGSDLIFRIDGKQVYWTEGEGDKYPEPMFAVLNFAKIPDPPTNHDLVLGFDSTPKSSMEGKWVMEVDWVKHEKRING